MSSEIKGGIDLSKSDVIEVEGTVTDTYPNATFEVELENGINFNGNTEIAIVLTEAELDDFTQNIPETCTAIYIGHDVLPTEEQEKIFAERKIKVNVIPEYYYRDLEG